MEKVKNPNQDEPKYRYARKYVGGAIINPRIMADQEEKEREFQTARDNAEILIALSKPTTFKTSEGTKYWRSKDLPRKGLHQGIGSRDLERIYNHFSLENYTNYMNEKAEKLKIELKISVVKKGNEEIAKIHDEIFPPFHPEKENNPPADWIIIERIK